MDNLGKGGRFWLWGGPLFGYLALGYGNFGGFVEAWVFGGHKSGEVEYKAMVLGRC